MMQRLLSLIVPSLIVSLVFLSPTAYATQITFSKTFVDGEVLTASDLETMKTNITDVVNAGGGPVTLTANQTISGNNTFSGTTTLSGATTASGAFTFTSTITATGGVFQGASPLVFEGATANDFETSFTFTDPTVDRTVTFPDAAVDLTNIGDDGDIIQIVHVQDGAFATGTTLMNDDDTIPQITEGTELMTLTITPTSTTNDLLIQVSVQLSNTIVSNHIVALFQDATSNALAAVWDVIDIADSSVYVINLTHLMNAGTTSATTFRVRAGPSSSSTQGFNGTTVRQLGGVAASTITITEIRDS